ncbi:MAG: DUF6851 domain-containing protein [Candidatus Cyclobacteriaceae bacterium M2_1C_046]
MRSLILSDKKYRLLKSLVITFFLSIVLCSYADAQHSVARKWNEVLLTAIRNDFARPPMHARNLFHVSAAMYDAWTVYGSTGTTWMLGKTNGNYFCPFEGISIPPDIESAKEEAISYAAYNIILHRFKNSPGKFETFQIARDLMIELGYDPDLTTTDYSDGLPSSLGNYIARSFIEFGLQDGSYEEDFYQNQFYTPVNPPLMINDGGNPFLIDPNRWQPLYLETFIDQSGNVVPSGANNFLAPEWGGVFPFALNSTVEKIYERDGFQYKVYHDPGPPPYIKEDGSGLSSEYKWGFALVSKWAAHLDHTDGVMWDISPASIGNIQELPTTLKDQRVFYDEKNGGDQSVGHAVNPHTGQSYAPQIVPRGDYTRVLAEFWADGPDSETPPGHWFSILNYVNDHPELVRKYKGEGQEIDPLEWDIKAYFTLGGAMHDAAIACWGIKGWYDYIRPVSAIRYMADQGQSSDNNLPNYSPMGLPLSKGFIELVEAGDPLEGVDGENVGKIKLYTWRGPDYIDDPTIDVAGVGWILAENWWPYQRPTFVTPPFAGYTSGHSTYSRAAAEVLTFLTGDEYFPGGMGEFHAKKNEFLVFERGPSMDVTLQWATYRDAADQCSLSRIWGSIHPPQDDIPGRIIGRNIGVKASYYAEQYFQGVITEINQNKKYNLEIYPNPVVAGEHVNIRYLEQGNEYEIHLLNIGGGLIKKWTSRESDFEMQTHGLKPGLYLLRKLSTRGETMVKLIVL